MGQGEFRASGMEGGALVEPGQYESEWVAEPQSGSDRFFRVKAELKP